MLAYFYIPRLSDDIKNAVRHLGGQIWCRSLDPSEKRRLSTTGCLESAYLVHHQKAYNLSEQQLVDCAQDFDNHGCNGGLPSHAFEYIQ